MKILKVEPEEKHLSYLFSWENYPSTQLIISQYINLTNSTLFKSFLSDQKFIFLLLERFFDELNILNKTLKSLCKLIYKEIRNKTPELLELNFSSEDSFICCLFIFSLQVLYNTNNILNAHIFDSNITNPLSKIIHNVKNRQNHLKLFLKKHNLGNKLSLKYFQIEDLNELCLIYNEDKSQKYDTKIDYSIVKDKEEKIFKDVPHSIFNFKSFYTINDSEIPKTIEFFLYVFCDVFDFKFDFLVKENQKFYKMIKKQKYYGFLSNTLLIKN